MKVRIRRLAMAVIVAVSLVISPGRWFAGDLPGRNAEEKLNNACYDIYQTMGILLDSYVGTEITPEMLYDAAMNGMTQILDEHSVYFNEDEYKQFKTGLSGHIMGIGIVLGYGEQGELIVRQVLEDTHAESSGILRSDVIVSINGKAAGELSLDEAAQLMNDDDIPDIHMEISRAGEIRSYDLLKSDIKIQSVRMLRFEDIFEFADKNDNSKIRYVAIDSIGADTAVDFKACLEQMTAEGVTGFVFDLRGNPGGYLEQAIEICEVLVPKGPIMYTLDSKGTRKMRQSELEILPVKDIYVLTDENTASAAEIITAALQDAKVAKVIGNVTYGKGVIQGSLPSITNGATKFTYMEYLRRSGEKINKIGVTPDIMVEQPGFVSNNISLGQNNRSEDLPALKQILLYLGYVIKDYSTLYDDVTREQIILFQTENNFNPTGDLDYLTIRAINYVLYDVYVQSDLVLETAYKMILNK